MKHTPEEYLFSFKAISGEVLYILIKPLLRILLRDTTRAYVAVRHEQDVLLIHNWLGSQTQDLPGGGCKRGETPLQAAVRELKEEVGIGLQPESLEFCTSGAWKTEGFRYAYYIYSVRVKEKPTVKTGKEVISAQWVPLYELEETDVRQEVRSALQSLN